MKKSFLIAKSICVFTFLFIISGISNTNALPILGSIIDIDNLEVNFKYKNNELDADVPIIKYKEALDNVLNEDIRKFTSDIIDDFFLDYNDLNHRYVKIDYDVLRDTKEWFTLKISVLEEAGSSNNYFKYYHIDKIQDKMIKLSDLFADKKYKEAIELEIKRQILLKDNSSEYNETIEIADDQNFYFDDDNNIVIVFNKYDIAPGYLGIQEFIIDYNIFSKYLDN